MSTDVCPTCATPRMGSFRFCRSCGFDYDASAEGPAAAMPSAAVPVPGVMTGPAVLAQTPAAGPATPQEAASAGTSWPGASGAIAATTLGAGAIGTPPPTDGAVEAKRADDVVVIKVRDLKLATGAIFGGLIGAMITGAFIVPGLGAERLAVAIILGILTIVASAALGARAGLAFIGR